MGRFTVNNETYNVPAEKEKDFLSKANAENKKVEKVTTYSYKGDTYNIPESKVADFRSSAPDAKLVSNNKSDRKTEYDEWLKATQEEQSDPFNEEGGTQTTTYFDPISKEEVTETIPQDEGGRKNLQHMAKLGDDYHRDFVAVPREIAEVSERTGTKGAWWVVEAFQRLGSSAIGGVADLGVRAYDDGYWARNFTPEVISNFTDTMIDELEEIGIEFQADVEQIDNTQKARVDIHLENNDIGSANAETLGANITGIAVNLWAMRGLTGAMYGQAAPMSAGWSERTLATLKHSLKWVGPKELLFTPGSYPERLKSFAWSMLYFNTPSLSVGAGKALFKGKAASAFTGGVIDFLLLNTGITTTRELIDNGPGYMNAVAAARAQAELMNDEDNLAKYILLHISPILASDAIPSFLGISTQMGRGVNERFGDWVQKNLLLRKDNPAITNAMKKGSFNEVDIQKALEFQESNRVENDAISRTTMDEAVRSIELESGKTTEESRPVDSEVKDVAKIEEVRPEGESKVEGLEGEKVETTPENTEVAKTETELTEQRADLQEGGAEKFLVTEEGTLKDIREVVRESNALNSLEKLKLEHDLESGVFDKNQALNIVQGAKDNTDGIAIRDEALIKADEFSTDQRFSEVLEPVTNREVVNTEKLVEAMKNVSGFPSEAIKNLESINGKNQAVITPVEAEALDTAINAYTFIKAEEGLIQIGDNRLVSTEEFNKTVIREMKVTGRKDRTFKPGEQLQLKRHTDKIDALTSASKGFYDTLFKVGGGDWDGALFRSTGQRVYQAYQSRKVSEERYLGSYRKQAKEAGITLDQRNLQSSDMYPGKTNKQSFDLENGQKIELTPNQVVDFINTARTDTPDANGNRHLTSPDGLWMLQDKYSKSTTKVTRDTVKVADRITDKDINNIVREGLINNNIKTAADFEWKWQNTVDADTVNNASIKNWGTQKATVRAHYNLSIKKDAGELVGSNKFTEGMTAENMPFLRSRTGKKGGVLIQDYQSKRIKRASQIAGYDAYTKLQRDLNKALSPEVLKQIEEIHGKDDVSTIKKFQDKIARDMFKLPEEGSDIFVLDKLANLTRGTAADVVVLSPSVWAKQAGSYPNTAMVLDTGIMAKNSPLLAANISSKMGLSQSILPKNFRAAVQDAYSMLPSMRSRAQGRHVDADVGESFQSHDMQQFFTNTRPFRDTLTSGVSRFDQGTMETIMYNTMEQALRDQGKTWSDYKVGNYNRSKLEADTKDLWMRVEIAGGQPMFDIPFRSKLKISNHPLSKIATTLSSFFEGQSRAFRVARAQFQRDGNKTSFYGKMGMIFAYTTMFGYTVNSARKAIRGDLDPDKEITFRNLIGGVVRSIGLPFQLVRPLTGFVADKIQGKRWADSSITSSPLDSWIDSIITVGESVGEALEDQDVDSVLNVVKKTPALAGPLGFGITSGTRTAQDMMKIFENFGLDLEDLMPELEKKEDPDQEGTGPWLNI